MAKSLLRADGVNLSYTMTSDKPTCLATVSLDAHGSASYEFLIDNTSTFDFSLDWLPTPSNIEPSVLHIGTLVTVIEPGASILFEWASKVSRVAPIVFDPNVRSAVMNDRKRYQGVIKKWLTISTVVKVSDEDLFWLYPGHTIHGIVQQWFDEAKSVSLIVVTKGAHGIDGFTRAGCYATVPALVVTVVDTVGAGDTVGAIMVEALIEKGLAQLQGDVLSAVLSRAAAAAAITCSRAGAQPPTRADIEEFCIAASATPVLRAADPPLRTISNLELPAGKLGEI
jgi:fructokinase